MKKKILIACLIALVGFLIVCSCLILNYVHDLIFEDDCLSKEEIFDVVNNNYNKIIADIQKGSFEQTEKIKGLESVKEKDGIIYFYCEGKGNVVSGAYYGFYYTTDNLPKVLPFVLFDEDDLVPHNNGFCFDKYDYYYTEKIRDNFYYFEQQY